jgi:hypothetical protein
LAAVRGRVRTRDLNCRDSPDWIDPLESHPELCSPERRDRISDRIAGAADPRAAQQEPIAADAAARSERAVGNERAGVRFLVLAAGRRRSQPEGAFLFPQMLLSDKQSKRWAPGFIDYLFLAFNTSTAFSPTDVPVLSRWAKLMMIVQASISLTTVALIAARAVNIL